MTGDGVLRCDESQRAHMEALDLAAAVDTARSRCQRYCDVLCLYWWGYKGSLLTYMCLRTWVVTLGLVFLVFLPGFFLGLYFGCGGFIFGRCFQEEEESLAVGVNNNESSSGSGAEFELLEDNFTTFNVYK